MQSKNKQIQNKKKDKQDRKHPYSQCRSNCATHKFQFKPKSENQYHPRTVISYCPLFSERTDRFESIIPKINADGKKYYPLFCIDLDKDHYQFHEEKYKEEHEKKVFDYVQQKEELYEPKPGRKTKWCAVCKSQYDDYLDHVRDQTHSHNSSTNHFIKEIGKIANLYSHKHSQNQELPLTQLKPICSEETTLGQKDKDSTTIENNDCESDHSGVIILENDDKNNNLQVKKIVSLQQQTQDLIYKQNQQQQSPLQLPITASSLNAKYISANTQIQQQQNQQQFQEIIFSTQQQQQQQYSNIQNNQFQNTTAAAAIFNSSIVNNNNNQQQINLFENQQQQQFYGQQQQPNNQSQRIQQFYNSNNNQQQNMSNNLISFNQSYNNISDQNIQFQNQQQQQQQQQFNTSNKSKKRQNPNKNNNNSNNTNNNNIGDLVTKKVHTTTIDLTSNEHTNINNNNNNVQEINNNNIIENNNNNVNVNMNDFNNNNEQQQQQQQIQNNPNQIQYLQQIQQQQQQQSLQGIQYMQQQQILEQTQMNNEFNERWQPMNNSMNCINNMMQSLLPQQQQQQQQQQSLIGQQISFIVNQY